MVQSKNSAGITSRCFAAKKVKARSLTSADALPAHQIDENSRAVAHNVHIRKIVVGRPCFVSLISLKINGMVIKKRSCPLTKIDRPTKHPKTKARRYVLSTSVLIINNMHRVVAAMSGRSRPQQSEYSLIAWLEDKNNTEKKPCIYF